MDETSRTEYRVSCTDTDGNRRVITTRDKEAAKATAGFWTEHRRDYTDVKITKR